MKPTAIALLATPVFWVAGWEIAEAVKPRIERDYWACRECNKRNVFCHEQGELGICGDCCKHKKKTYHPIGDAGYWVWSCDECCHELTEPEKK